MKRFLVFLAAMLLSGLAFADDMLASNGGDSVRLTDKPCPEPVLSTIPPELQGKVRAASAVINGRFFAACWIVSGGYVVLQYEDSDTGVIPMSEFRRSPGV